MAYDAPPQRFDHELRIGDTYQPVEVQLTDETGAAYSIVGATGTAKVRDRDGNVLLTPTVTLTDAANGRFTWSSTAAETAALKAGEAEFGVRLTFADTTVRTILLGHVTILPSAVG